MLTSLPPTRPLTAVHLTRGVAPPTLVSMMSAAYSSLWLADPPAAPPPFAPPPAAPPPGSALGFDSPRRPTTSQGTSDHNHNPNPNHNHNPSHKCNPSPNPNPCSYPNPNPNPDPKQAWRRRAEQSLRDGRPRAKATAHSPQPTATTPALIPTLTRSLTRTQSLTL